MEGTTAFSICFFFTGEDWKKYKMSVFRKECDVVWQYTPALLQSYIKGRFVGTLKYPHFKPYLICTEELRMVIQKRPVSDHARTKAP